MKSKPTRRLVVDATTGAVVAQHSGDGPEGAVFTEMDVDISDPGEFVWGGPVQRRP